MSYGNIKISSKKSLEGSLACLFVCCAVGSGVFWGIHLFEYIVFVGALGATLAELIPGIDDNVTIPLISGAAMTFAVWRLDATLPSILG